MSPKTGRPKKDDARDKKINIRLRQDELDLIEKCANKLQKSRTDAIMQGVNLLDKSLEKQKE